MKQIISKFIATVYEKNYAEADSLLQQIISEKVKGKIKKVIKTPAKVQTSIFFKSDGKAFKTKYEMYDAFGNLLKKGYDNEVDCSNLLNGIYFINFDNKSEKFIKY